MSHRPFSDPGAERFAQAIDHLQTIVDRKVDLEIESIRQRGLREVARELIVLRGKVAELRQARAA